MADLVSKSGTNSIVWQYFGLRKGKDVVAIDDGTAVCRSCRKTVMEKRRIYWLTCVFTTVICMLKLLQVCMKGGKQRAEPGKCQYQKILTQVVETAQSYERMGKKWKELTESVVVF